MNLKKGIILLISLLVLGKTFAQQAEEVDENKMTLDAQFEALVKKSNSYKNFKVIELRKLKSFQSNMKDSVHLLYQEIAENETTINEQGKNTEELKTEISQLEEDLAEAIAEKNSFFFMGMQLEKTLFKNIFWLVSIGLLLCLMFFILKYFRSQRLTVKAQQDLIEAQNEIEELRRKHIKKEQKIMRQLQDEINKNSH